MIPVEDRIKPRTGAPHRDWLSASELASLTPATLVERVRAVAPMAAAAAAEAERRRHPDDEVWAALRATGLFYHFVPKRYGGLEFDLGTFVEAILPLAEACPSTAWVASFCMEHNWILANFPVETQDEIFGQLPYVIAPAASSPPGKATAVEGGFRLNGRWKWGSGVMHADWVFLSGMAPGRDGPGFFALPIDEVEVLDTWHLDGMAATGSNDIVALDVFVPAHRWASTNLMRDGEGHGGELHGSNIYRLPILPFLTLTAALPAIGAARASVVGFRQRMQERTVFGTEQKQAEKPAAHMHLARADLAARTAEMLLRESAREMQDLADRRAASDTQARVRLRAQLAYAVEHARRAVRIVAEASGSSAHHLSNPIQRALRDVNVIATHVVFDMDMATEQHGRLLIGLPANSPLT